ncbi:hypothetical protein ACFWXH_19435 [Mesorhizobium sp. NPDC059054]|uniref:hypothetical protein n=1 Tax=Mesorhizobium sp. NPDC059054 TaxID=3346711 RepID=UPI0036BB3147
MKQTRGRRFKATALVTPTRIRTEPEEVFALENCPHWVRSIELIVTDADGGMPTEAVATVGRKHPKIITANLFALAVLFEMTRYGGISVVTNSNHAKRPSIYAKMSFPMASDHLVSIRRILFDAEAGQVTKPVWREHDYSPESTRTEPDAHPKRRSRATAMQHVEEAAQVECRDPELFLANLRALFTEVDRLRDGGAQ